MSARLSSSTGPVVGESRRIRDCFISHAFEDKEAVARPLARALKEAGYDVWYDEFELEIGDSLREKIDDGLAGSRFGVVVLSEKFFEKKWAKFELDALVTRQMVGSERVILPVWHEIDESYLQRVSPTLASLVAVPSAPLDVAVEQIGNKIDRRRDIGTPGVGALPARTPSKGARTRTRPKQHEARNEGSVRLRRRAVVGGAVLCGAVSFAIVFAVAPINGSAKDGLRFGSGEATFQAPRSWRVAPLLAVDRQKEFDEGVHGEGVEALTGQAEQGQLPFPAPGIATYKVQLPAGKAVRADGVQALNAQRAYEFRSGRRYVVLACRNTGGGSKVTKRACDRLAGSASFPQQTGVPPQPSKAVWRDLVASLHEYETSIRKGIEDASASQSRASAAAALAGAAKASTLAGRLAGAPQLRALRHSFSRAAAAWAAAARAARRGESPRYAAARRLVDSAERRINRVRKGLLALGFRRED